MEYIKLFEKYHTKIMQSNVNKIEKLLELDFNDVMINGHNEVYLDFNSKMKKLDNYFLSKQELFEHTEYFLSKCNQRLSVDKPLISFDYKNLFRFYVVHKSISDTSHLITIRKFMNEPLTRNTFIKNGFCSRSELDFIEELVRKKKTIFISGQTSSGKTTLLNYLLQYTDSNERIIVIEDTKEIKIAGSKNAVYLRTKEKEMNVRKVSISDLIKSALRMRPDRIILGEIRREEIIDFLHAISTGHEGSISTGHGSSARDMIARLEILLLEADIPIEAAKRYLGMGIDYIIQLNDKSKRSIREITKIGYLDGEIKFEKVTP